MNLQIAACLFQIILKKPACSHNTATFLMNSTLQLKIIYLQPYFGCFFGVMSVLGSFGAILNKF